MVRFRDKACTCISNNVCVVIRSCWKNCVVVFKGYEDWLRHKADREVNNRPTKVIRQGRVQNIPSKNVKVRYK